MSRLDPAAEQAIDWMLRLHSGASASTDAAAFAAWHAHDEANRAAWARLSERLDGPYAQVRAIDARLPGQAGEVREVLLRPPQRRRFLLRSLAAAGLLGGSAWLTDRVTPLATLTADLRTGTGERRDIRLADGSQLALNARSAVDVAFDGHTRALYLRRGELVVDVAPGDRPFLVHTRHGSARALGTRFAVREEGSRSLVAMLAHSTELLAANGHRLRLEEGESAVLDGNGIARLSLRPASLGAWTGGLLVADDLPLAEVVERLRPYCRGLLRLAPNAAGLRVQGVFPLDDPARSFTALAETLPLKVADYGLFILIEAA